MSFSSMKIGSFLKRSKIPIDIVDNKEYKRVTIRIKHNGVSLRDVQLGKRIGTKKQFVLKAGQFILSKIDARYGAFGIAGKDVNDAIITGNFWAYDVDENRVNIDWFNQYTSSPQFYELCERASSGITHRKYLDEVFFLNHQINLPSVDQQLVLIDKIKSQKDKFNSLIKEQNYQTETLKRLRRQILQDAVQGKLVPQNPKDEPASVLLKKINSEKERLIKEGKLKTQKTLPPIKEEELSFELPNGWIWIRLSELCTHIGSGSTPRGGNYSKDGIPFFRSQNIYDGELNLNDIKFISSTMNTKMKSTIVKANDLLLNITGGSIGRCALVPDSIKIGNVSQHVCIIRSILMNSRFVHKIILSPYFQNMILDSTTGAGREGLPKYNLEKFLIPLAPLSEQTRIVNKVEALLEICDNLEKETLQNQKLSQQLLQSALKEALEPKVN